MSVLTSSLWGKPAQLRHYLGFVLTQAIYRQLECGMRAVNSIAVASATSLLFVAGTCNAIEVHVFALPAGT
jgi:hypothetical protein